MVSFLNRLKSASLNSNGDTIIEVMVVLVLIGFALSIAYATASESIIETRQAEENAQATTYVASQIEELRLAAEQDTNDQNSPNYSNANNVFAAQKPFCLDPTLTISNPNPPSSNCTDNNSLFSVVIYNCDLLGNNSECATTTPLTDTFIVYATWPDVAGDGTDSVTQVYRGHPI
jgi:type II secretory pathway pseudopilin PulG